MFESRFVFYSPYLRIKPTLSDFFLFFWLKSRFRLLWENSFYLFSTDAESFKNTSFLLGSLRHDFPTCIKLLFLSFPLKPRRDFKIVRISVMSSLNRVITSRRNGENGKKEEGEEKQSRRVSFGFTGFEDENVKPPKATKIYSIKCVSNVGNCKNFLFLFRFIFLVGKKFLNF